MELAASGRGCESGVSWRLGPKLQRRAAIFRKFGELKRHGKKRLKDVFFFARNAPLILAPSNKIHDIHVWIYKYIFLIHITIQSIQISFTCHPMMRILIFSVVMPAWIFPDLIAWWNPEKWPNRTQEIGEWDGESWNTIKLPRYHPNVPNSTLNRCFARFFCAWCALYCPCLINLLACGTSYWKSLHLAREMNLRHKTLPN